jgi:hypothetical protein
MRSVTLQFPDLRAQVRSVPTIRRAVVEARHIGARRSDAFLVSFPKSGSTWLRFMLAHALTGTDVDFETVERVIPQVGAHRGRGFLPTGGRLIKSHEPFRGTYGRRYSRVVYVARNVESVAISYYWFKVRRGEYVGDLSMFVDALVDGAVDGYGSWLDHVEGWLDAEQAGRCDLHLVRYEDLLLHPAGEVAKALEFLGCAIDQEHLASVVESNTRSRMSAKEARSPVLSRRMKADVPFVAESQIGRPSPLGREELAKLTIASRAGLVRLGYIEP